MGRQAQKTVGEYFSLSRFRNAFLQSIETARAKRAVRKVDPCVPVEDVAALRTDFVQPW